MKAAYYSFCRAISKAFFTKIAFNNPKDLLKIKKCKDKYNKYAKCI